MGTLPLLQLLLELGDRQGVPVLAAGGIVTGAGIAAVLAAGAAGLDRHRFMATPEARGTPAAKGRLLRASERDTVRTRRLRPGDGHPGRPGVPWSGAAEDFPIAARSEDALRAAAASAPEEVAAALAGEPVVDAGQASAPCARSWGPASSGAPGPRRRAAPRGRGGPGPRRPPGQRRSGGWIDDRGEAAEGERAEEEAEDAQGDVVQAEGRELMMMPAS